MSKQKRRGRIWIAVGIFILALLAFWIGRFAFYIHDLNTPPETGIKRYLSSAGDGWVSEDPYYLFPAKEDVLNADDYEYLHKHNTSISFLFDNDVVAYLRCTFSEEQFKHELDRLERLCGPADEKALSSPAFIPWDHYFREYGTFAQVDEQSKTIYYYAFQGRILMKKYFPEQERPNYVSEGQMSNGQFSRDSGANRGWRRA
ncbi:MAG: hypothetical protein IJI27_10830 [Oscillospiraceae bacterium]|nr:hypothetical protein [Oscillospiraceae bacterium]